jgi:sulfopyruvate decarboxylase subunit alpha
MRISERLLETLKLKGVDFFCTVPCRQLTHLIALLEQEPRIVYVPVTREEEGYGLCAGACLAGRRPAILMQNSGLGNSVNALASLAKFYQLPITTIMTYRGRAKERVAAQIPMGRATEGLLEQLEIPYRVLNSPMDIDVIGEMVDFAHEVHSPVAVLLESHFWKESVEAV